MDLFTFLREDGEIDHSLGDGFRGFRFADDGRERIYWRRGDVAVAGHGRRENVGAFLQDQLRRQFRELAELLRRERLGDRDRDAAMVFDLLAIDDALRPRLGREIDLALLEAHFARGGLAGNARPRPHEIDRAEIAAKRQLALGNPGELRRDE